MKRFLLTLAIVASAAPVFAADVGVSVSVGQPGFYGRLDIGNFPQPQLVYPQPVIIQAAPVGVVAPQPLYLHVPPGHAKKWRKHCHKYNACGQPVYFVQEGWYNNVYVPRYQEAHRGHHDHDWDGDHGKKHKHKGKKHKHKDDD